MATINLTGTTLTAGVPDTDAISVMSKPMYVAKVVLDLTASALTENDIYQVFAIPKNTQIMSVRSKIVTPAVGTTLTIDIGVGGTDGWNADIDGKAVANTWTTSVCGTDALAVSPAASASGLQGTFYAEGSTDTIDVTMDVATAITAGPKIELYFTCVDFN